MPPRSRAARRISALSSTRRARAPCRRRAPRALCAEVPASAVRRVGLFVDADDDAIEAALDSGAARSSCNSTAARARSGSPQVKARFGRPVMKAIPVAGAEDVAAASRYEDCADLLLFDAKPPRRDDALPGGNGLAFDWRLIAGRAWRRPWMLSGGLTAALLPEAVRISGATRGRCVLRRRAPPRRQGPGKDPRIPRRSPAL